jgi:hypothetical protein
MWVNALYSYPYLNQQKPLFLPIMAYTLFNKIRDKGKGGGGGKGGLMTQTLYAHMN